jgi:hypothetical protein
MMKALKTFTKKYVLIFENNRNPQNVYTQKCKLEKGGVNHVLSENKLNISTNSTYNEWEKNIYPYQRQNINKRSVSGTASEVDIYRYSAAYLHKVTEVSDMTLTWRSLFTVDIGT